ncbi:hypothetical protein, partial [Streptomyces roseolus]|uniref:hypothetical protein n=1 Tax=Streptomyces roseolus TaxID=67358 RepID=UPI003647ACA4
VPAIASTGTSRINGSTTHAGMGILPSGGIIPVIGSGSYTSVQSSALAASTSPALPRRSLAGLAVGGVLLLVVALMMVSILIMATALHAPPRDFGGHVQSVEAQPVDAGSNIVAWLIVPSFGVLPFLIPSLILLSMAWRRYRANTRVVLGLPSALAVWRAGFYCHRCGVCFWVRSPARGVAAGQPLSLWQFQQIVWSAGGYSPGMPAPRKPIGNRRS